MKDIIISILIVILGLIVWIALAYLAIAYYKLEFNPLLWAKDARGCLIFIAFIYLCFTPLVFQFVYDEL